MLNKNDGNESVAASPRSSSIICSHGGKKLHHEHYLMCEWVCHKNRARKLERQL